MTHIQGLKGLFLADLYSLATLDLRCADLSVIAVIRAQHMCLMIAIQQRVQQQHHLLARLVPCKLTSLKAFGHVWTVQLRVAEHLLRSCVCMQGCAKGRCVCLGRLSFN